MFFRLALFALLLPATAVQAADSLDPDLTALTENGLSIRIFSQLTPLQINRIHSWTLEISDSNGSPLSNVEVEVVGGMPEHDHGLPTQPQITDEPEPGSYLLEGVRFHMPGEWQLIVTIRSDDLDDQAVIEFQL